MALARGIGAERLARFVLRGWKTFRIFVVSKKGHKDMGMPLSRFSVFASFCKNDPNVRKVLDGFKLTAIVLNSPADKYFSHILANEYRFLDRATGDQLLFITFTHDGSNRNTNIYAHSAENDRRLLRNDRDIDDDNLIDLLRRFGVRGAQLPVMVLTNDLSSEDYIVINTSEKDIRKQIVELTSFCDKQEGKVRLSDPEFEVLIGKLDQDARWSKLRTKYSVARLLADVFAQVKIRRKSFIPDLEAEEWVKANLDVSNKAMEQAESIVESERDEIERDRFISELSLRLHKAKSLFNQNEKGLYCIDLAEMKGGEIESLKDIISFNDYVSFIDNEEQLNGDEHVQRDLNTATFLLGKIFERELNASVVQLMRKCVGIPMPECFLKPCYLPGDYTIAVGMNKDGSTRTVNLNKKGRGVWYNLTIGDANSAFKAMRDALKNMEVHEEELSVCSVTVGDLESGLFSDEFSCLWETIKNQRNSVAHAGRQTNQTFLDIYDAFRQLLQYGFYQQMMEVKKQLCSREQWERNVRNHHTYLLKQRRGGD